MASEDAPDHGERPRSSAPAPPAALPAKKPRAERFLCADNDRVRCLRSQAAAAAPTVEDAAAELEEAGQYAQHRL